MDIDNNEKWALSATSLMSLNHIEKAISKNYNYVQSTKSHLFSSSSLVFFSLFLYVSTLFNCVKSCCVNTFKWPFFFQQGHSSEYEKWNLTTNINITTTTNVMGLIFWVAFHCRFASHIYLKHCFVCIFRLNCLLYSTIEAEANPKWKIVSHTHKRLKTNDGTTILYLCAFKCGMCVFVYLKQTRYN